MRFSQRPYLFARASSHSAMIARGALIALLFSLTMLTTACGGSSALQNQATQSKAKLDSNIQQAQKIGVPSSPLTSVQKQEQQLSSTGAPFNLFNAQPVNDYYQNLATRYTQLAVQVQAIITATTEQSQSQAQLAMQNFQTTLSQKASQKLPVQYFSQQYSHDQSLLATATYPKDYYAIINDAHSGTQALNLLESVSTQLGTLKNTIAQMQNAHLDVTAMTAQYQSDMKTWSAGTHPIDFTNLSNLINVQYQQAVATSTAALPYVENAKLSMFETDIQQLKTYGGNISAYQQRLSTDQALMSKARGINDYLAFSKQIDSDIASMHDDLIHNEASYLIKQSGSQLVGSGKSVPRQV